MCIPHDRHIGLRVTAMKCATEPKKFSPPPGASRVMAVWAAFCAGICPLADAGATELRVEGQPGWVVSDDPEPMLSWKPVAEIDGEAVAGYEVVVAKNREDAMAGKGTWWKSAVLPLAGGPRLAFDAAALPSRAEA